jgi:predicted AAA+ superfamily ATPase
VGKSAAQLQLIEDLLGEGVEPQHIYRLHFGDVIELLTGSVGPILRLVEWYEATNLGTTINAVAYAGGKTYLFLDDVQRVANWGIQLKALVDNNTVQVVVTGSPALDVDARGDSLGGRISTIDAEP